MGNLRNHKPPTTLASVLKQCALIACIVALEAAPDHGRHSSCLPPARQFNADSTFHSGIEFEVGLTGTGGRELVAGVVIRVRIGRATLAGNLLVEGAEDRDSGAQKTDEELSRTPEDKRDGGV